MIYYFSFVSYGATYCGPQHFCVYWQWLPAGAVAGF